MLQRLKWAAPILLLGMVGAAIRWWQVATAFEGELHLCVRNAPASWMLIITLALAVVVLLYICATMDVKVVGKRKSRFTLWDRVFAADGDTVYLTLMVLAGFLTLAAAPFLFLEAARMMAVRKATGEGDTPLLQLILALCTIPGGAGLILSGKSAFRMEGRGRDNTALLFPPMFSCVWLLECYRANAADPVLWDYVPVLLPAALGMLFYMEVAAMAFAKPHPRRMLWLAAMTAATSCTALGGLPAPSTMLLLGGQLMAALAALWIAPENMTDPPKRLRFRVRAAPETSPNAEPGRSESAPAQNNAQEDTTHGQ